MTGKKGKKQKNIKDSRFPPSLFGVYLGVLLLMSGIHTGLVVYMNTVGIAWNDVIKSTIPIIYWGMIAVGLTIFTRKQMKKTYDEPLQEFARATGKVAKGDFSVYMPTLHTSDKLDYLDMMILDFNKMVEELGSIETLKTDFISNVSHEMKTPIAVIKNYAELIRSGNLPEAQRVEYAQAIIEASMRLSDLIGNILKLNKLENQNINPEIKEYDVCRQLCESILQFENVWEEREIELETDIEDVARVTADENLMELVWNNLLSNAMKFTEPGGMVTVRQWSDAQKVMVSVTDTGCGMSREVKVHIFDKFYQGDTSHAKEGNGLGMALAKRVIDLMGGEILVISEEGKGSTFTVTLPAAGVATEIGGM